MHIECQLCSQSLRLSLFLLQICFQPQLLLQEGLTAFEIFGCFIWSGHQDKEATTITYCPSHVEIIGWNVIDNERSGRC